MLVKLMFYYYFLYKTAYFKWIMGVANARPFPYNPVISLEVQSIMLKKQILELNCTRSEEYRSARESLKRRQYRGKYPTQIIALKCMDGRLLLPGITKTPIGIIDPFRNLGGKFDLGWPFFGYLVGSTVDYAIKKGRDVLILVTYHFSKGDKNRGCAGHGYDTEAAMIASQKLVKQLDAVFGGFPHETVYPILVGIETDEDALIFHGHKGELLNLAKVEVLPNEQIKSELTRLYPDMKERIVNDLVPLVKGNLDHIHEVRITKRPITDMDHKEQILAIGRGFDWLHMPNRALIVGPYSYDLTDPISKAAGILLANFDAGRIPKDGGALIMTSAAYRDNAGSEKNIAKEKARSLFELTMTTIERAQPRLLKEYRIETLIGTVDSDTRYFEKI